MNIVENDRRTLARKEPTWVERLLKSSDKTGASGFPNTRMKSPSPQYIGAEWNLHHFSMLEAARASGIFL